MYEQRQHDRYEFSGEKIEFTLSPFSEDEIFKAGVINYSETGMCLLSEDQIPCGQEVIISNFQGLFSRTALVVWVEKYDDIFYLNKADDVLFKIGLEFV